jgi:hypothetical protein
LLIAIGVGSLLILMLSSIVSSSSQVWRRVNDSQDITVEAKAALEIIQSDLQSAVFRDFPDHSECFRISRFPDEEGPFSNKTAHADWLLFFSASRDRDEDATGMTSAVSYRLVYRDAISEGGESPRFFLYRVLVDPATTYRQILNRESLTGSYWNRQTATLRGHIIASDIVDFQVTTLLINSQGQVFRVPGDVEFRLRGKSVELEGGNGDDLPIDPETKIHSFELSVTVISPEGRARLEDNESLQEVVNRHGRRFSQVVTMY